MTTREAVRDLVIAAGGRTVPARGAVRAEKAQRNLVAYHAAARSAFSASTVRALRSDSAIFTTWCTERSKAALPATPATVAAFVDDQAQAKKPATVRRYVASIAHMHRAAEVANPCERNPVKLALKRMGNTSDGEQRQAKGTTRKTVDKMMRAGGDQVRDLRNRALLAVAYDTLARRSELVALQLADLHVTPEGDGSIKIRRSKTDRKGEGSTRYLAPDTVQAVRAWTVGGEVRNGTLFRSVLKGSRVGGPLLPRDVSLIYKQMAARAGLPLATVDQISGHSTRVGAAQDMAASGKIEMAAIMQAGGWKSPAMVARYTAQQAVRRSGTATLATSQKRAKKQAS